MVLEKKIFKSRQYIFTILLSSTIGDKNVKKLQTDTERDGRMTVDQKSSFKFPAHVSKNELVLNIYIYVITLSFHVKKCTCELLAAICAVNPA